MTATSDLDLIIVYDFDPEHPQSDGARSLYGAQYFARLTQRLISALSSQTNYGALYQVDMRLRPSGRSGPVATQPRRFRELSGDRGLDLGAHGADARARRVGVRRDSRRRSRRSSATCSAASAMPRDRGGRRRNAAGDRKGKGRDARWDFKYAAGGLVDLEFIAQYLQLVHAAEHPDILDTSTARVLDKAWRLGLLPAEDADVLRPGGAALSQPHADPAAVPPGPFDPKTAGRGCWDCLPGGRPAEFRHARRAPRRDAAEGARELRANFGSKAPQFEGLALVFKMPENCQAFVVRRCDWCSIFERTEIALGKTLCAWELGSKPGTERRSSRWRSQHGAAAPTHAQSAKQKYDGKIVCGSFSGDPKKYPAWNDNIDIMIDRGVLIATPSRPQGQVMTGTVAPSGAVLIAGEGGTPGQPPEWTYEFAGKLNPKGPTVLRGQLANIMGGGAKRSCSISFEAPRDPLRVE